MQERLKTEFEAFAIYFLIAFTAELLGFMGWLSAMGRSGGVFTVENVFWIHELSRLSVWLPVFLGLSAIRLLVVFLTPPSRKGERKTAIFKK